ncbi:MAG: hypothetical protein JRJ29_20395, partial [Deltaproteobacteria bacterium]|nr:hypothetical protein [Deltaproteobacteria bacterium]
MKKAGCLLILNLCIFLGVSLYPAHPAEGKNFTIKFATIAPEGSTWMKYMRQLERKIREKSNGQLRFKIYAGGIA